MKINYKNILKSTKKKRIVISTLLVLMVVLSATFVNVDFKNPVKTDDGNLKIGTFLNITIGTDEAYASITPDYTTDGVADDVQFQAALNALPATGGKLTVLAGTYNFTALTTVTRAINNITIEGVGQASYFTCDGVTPIFTTGGNNWIFKDLRTDAGGITMGATTGWQWIYVNDGTNLYKYRDEYTSIVGNSFDPTNIAAATFTADNTWSVAQTGMTLTAPAINGVVTTTGLTLPALTLGGTVTGAAQTLSNLGDVTIGDGKGMVIGSSTVQLTTPWESEFQVLGTATVDSRPIIARFSGDINSGGLAFIKSRGVAITNGTAGIVQDNDYIAHIYGYVDDGTDLGHLSTQIRMEVDDAAPAANAVGGAIVLSTSTTAGALAEGIRINSSQGVHMPNLKSGINQGAAGAAAGELWVDTDDDNTVKLGT